MSETHTPGRLHVECGPEPIRQQLEEDAWAILGPDSHGVPMAMVYVDMHHYGADTEANAAFLRDCWNACEAAGITNPAKQIPEMVEAVRRLLAGYDDDDNYNDGPSTFARAVLAALKPTE